MRLLAEIGLARVSRRNCAYRMRMEALCGLPNMLVDAHLEVLYGLECSPAVSLPMAASRPRRVKILNF
jgi:hypothetical protein